MSSSKGLIYCGGLGLALAVLALRVGAGPVAPDGVAALGRGWLASGRLRLTAPMAGAVRSIESFRDFHVIHLDPEGFLVTAADDELEPVVAFSARGQFEAVEENPLWVLLNRDMPERTAWLQALRERRVGVGLADDRDRVALAEIEGNRAKWKRFRDGVAEAGGTVAVATSGRAGLARLDPVLVGEGRGAAEPIRIRTFQVQGDRVWLSHDAAVSVSIEVSYDSGDTWQVLDTGVIQPEWGSKMPMREPWGLFRVAADGLYDEMTVAFLRQPPVVQDEIAPLPGVPPEDESVPLSAASLGTISDVRVAPLIQSRWSQSSAQGHACYNLYTPNNYVCGCVATALAQVLRYWQYPVSGIGRVTQTIYVNGVAQSATTRGGDGLGGAYAWGSMPLAPGSVAYNAAQWQMVGAVCYDAGLSVNMMYSGGGSGAYMSRCAAAYTGVFHYADAHYLFYPSNLPLLLDTCLEAGCPVLLGISANGTSGHAIICDGFGYDAGTLYHHLNLGWGGAYDAWYALPAIGTPYGFNSIDTVIFNVFPTGSGELIAGRVTTVQGVAVQGATLSAVFGSETYTATSDAKGYYGVKVPAARSYSVTARRTGMSTATRTGVAVGTSGTSACGNVLGVDFALTPFSMTAVGLTDSVWLRWTAPTNTGLPNNTVYIRHRTDGFPASATDGTEVYRGTAQQFVHEPVDATGTVTNYYSIWGDNGEAYADIGGSPQASACADPGRLKLFWTSTSASMSAVWLLKADGSKRSSGYVGTLSTGWTLSAVGDMDGDGAADLFWHNPTLGKVAYWLMDPDGVRRSSGYVGNSTNGWSLVGCGDIDRDGTTDLIWHQPTLGKTACWFLNADGSLRSAVSLGDITPGWNLVGIGDIDRDGTPDLIWHHPTLGKAAYWLLTSSGSRRSSGYIGDLSVGWILVGVGDVDRDGTADLIWHQPIVGKVAYWLLNSNGSKRTSGYVGDITAGWTLAGTGDADGDGTMDLIWQSASAGKVAYWLLNADGTKRASGYAGSISTGWTLSGCAEN